MRVESGLVSDDEVEALGGGAFEDIHGGHHGYGDAGYGRVWIAGFEGVDGFGVPGDADLFLDFGDDLAGGGVSGLGVGGDGGCE